MISIHHSILCQTQDEYDTALAILRTPIIEPGPKRGVLRRRRNRTIILAWHIGHFMGCGEYEKRHTLWLAERSDADAEIWERIMMVLEPLNLESTDDSSEAWRFLGRV